VRTGVGSPIDTLMSQNRERFRGRGTSFRSRVVSTFAAQVMVLAMGTLQGAVIARSVGADGKGQIAIAALAGVILQLILNPGFSAAYVYFSAANRVSVADLCGHAVALSSLAALITLPLASLAAGLGVSDAVFRSIPGFLLLLSVADVPFSMLFTCLRAILLGRQQIHLMNGVGLARGAAQFVAIVALLVGANGGAGAVMASLIFADAVGVALAVSALREPAQSYRPRWDRTLVRRLVGYGLRAHIGNFTQFFNYRLDQLILNRYAGASPVGIYSVAVTLSELLWEFPNSVATVLFARSASDDGDRGGGRFARTALRSTFALTAVGGVALAVVARPAIGLVYSNAFLPAYAPLLWLLPGTIVFGGVAVLANDLAGRGMPQYNGIVSGFSLVLTTVLDFVLIPSHGAVGAAIASSIAYASSFIVITLITKRVAGRTRPR
jgi:O-antigen/teichoic acid export membrane protein